MKGNPLDTKRYSLLDYAWAAGLAVSFIVALVVIGGAMLGLAYRVFRAVAGGGW